MKIRHGDLLLTKVETMPNGKTIKHDGQYILAEGEMTGHAHRLTGDPNQLKVREKRNVTYMSLTIPMPLTHEEHKTIEIPFGIWKLTFEKEYDYFLEEIKQVED